MASVKDTVKHSMLEYPSISPNPEAVLHHLFVVIGNGCEWEGGELVSYPPLKTPIDVVEIATRNRRELFDRIQEWKEGAFGDFDSTLDLERELINYDFTVANIERITDPSNIHSGGYLGRRHLYPWSPTTPASTTSRST